MVPALPQGGNMTMPQPKVTGEYYVKGQTTLADGTTSHCVIADLKAPEGQAMSGN